MTGHTAQFLSGETESVMSQLLETEEHRSWGQDGGEGFKERGRGHFLPFDASTHGGTKEFWENKRPPNPPTPPPPPPVTQLPPPLCPPTHTHSVAADGVYLAFSRD